MGHKVPQSQYFHGLWHSFFFSTVKDGIILYFFILAITYYNIFLSGEFFLYTKRAVHPHFLSEEKLYRSFCIHILSVRLTSPVIQPMLSMHFCPHCRTVFLLSSPHSVHISSGCCLSYPFHFLRKLQMLQFSFL